MGCLSLCAFLSHTSFLRAYFRASTEPMLNACLDDIGRGIESVV